MDRDGITDLIASGGDLVGSVAPYWASGFVFILRGNGDGTFQDPIAFATNKGPRSVVIGDFNGDGVPDAATGNLWYGYFCESFDHLWDSVSILPGFGDGRLGPAASYALGDSEDLPDINTYRGAHHRLNTSDLNADGKTDLIASPGAILLSTPPSQNRSPVADAGEPQRVLIGAGLIVLRGSATDPDNDWLTFQWTDETGQVVGNVARPCVLEIKAQQTFTLTVADGRGGVSVDTVTKSVQGNRFPEAGRTATSDRWDVREVPPGTARRATVRASGADIWRTSDAFQFANSLVTGDFDIVTRVVSVEHVHDWTKAGLIIRDGLSPKRATPSSLRRPLRRTASRSSGGRSPGARPTHQRAGGGASRLAATPP